MPQLDENRIVIRERQYVDLLDLSLKVVARHAAGLALATTAGVGPMILLNHCLLAGYVDQYFVLGEPVRQLSTIGVVPLGMAASWGLVWYMLIVLLLIFLEMPVATAATTLYLGQAMFSGQPDARRIWREFRQSLPQLLVLQSLLLLYPYLNEVILLERNPMRAESPGKLSIIGRCHELHRGGLAEAIVFRLVGLGTGVVVFAGIWIAILAARAILLGTAAIDLPMQTVYFQVSVWGAVGFFCVVRFLNYLNLKIRREGWEVELKLRAEAARLAEGLK